MGELCQRSDCGHDADSHDRGLGECYAELKRGGNCVCKGFQSELDPLVDSVNDECPTCGAWMLNPGLHKEWHERLKSSLVSISASAASYKHPPTYATSVAPGEPSGTVMTQEAPYPFALADLVDALKYKPRWQITLEDIDRGQGSKGLTLCILITTPDSYNPERLRSVMHYMPVPPAAFDERSWRRWLFEQFLLVERHEACEFFQINGERPYAPHHGPGNDPYIVFDHGTDEDVRTSYLGSIKSAETP